LGQKTSRNALLCCLTIVAGFFLGVDQEDVAGLFIFYFEISFIFRWNFSILVNF